MSLDDQPLTLSDFKKLMSEHEQNDAKMKIEMIGEFMSAFPGGDPIPHRNYHQAKIDAAVAEKEFWDAAKLKVFERGLGGILDVVKIVLILACVGVSVKFGLAIPFLGGKP